MKPSRHVHAIDRSLALCRELSGSGRSTSLQFTIRPGPMDPESSDSDVSLNPGIGDVDWQGTPLPLPPSSSKQALESTDGVQGRLSELRRVENHNNKKHDQLRAKRTRKDEKIHRGREIQNEKWAAILEARQRRDARIEARRTREDAAFSQVDDELEEEDSNLRRRLKRLKRGWPLDESPKPCGNNITSSSMSPARLALPTLPPPPKRHQVSLQGRPGAINPSQSRPSPPSNFRAATTAKWLAPAPAPAPVPVPVAAPASTRPSSFARDYSSSDPGPYYSSIYSTTPINASPTMSKNGPSHNPHPPADRSQFGQLGRAAFPLSSPAPNLVHLVPSNPSFVSPTTDPNPFRQIYDTLPPPTTASSGIASINAQLPSPPVSGFTTINPRTTGTQPASQVPLSRRASDPDSSRTLNQQPNHGTENDSLRPHSTAPARAVGTPTASTSMKRAPSTTRPHRMSQEFTNRHHHCERVDSLNRGIWTFYGMGGTADNPTKPAVEMHLRCNHDGCARIDWHTVHGLRCHIVKDHNQPKGTIVSLEKALERYGVPVKEVEDFERGYGKGVTGTVTNSKILKVMHKTTNRDFSGNALPRPLGPDSNPTPAWQNASPVTVMQTAAVPGNTIAVPLSPVAPVNLYNARAVATHGPADVEPGQTVSQNRSGNFHNTTNGKPLTRLIRCGDSPPATDITECHPDVTVTDSAAGGGTSATSSTQVAPGSYHVLTRSQTRNRSAATGI